MSSSDVERPLRRYERGGHEQAYQRSGLIAPVSDADKGLVARHQRLGRRHDLGLPPLVEGRQILADGLERSVMLERQRIGIDAAKRRQDQVPRTEAMGKRDKIVKLDAEGMTRTAIAKGTGGQ
ncbi:hypothetical protein NKJ13_31110 [Mesorhizobium sp. M0174]|uniref:hypothetical protein n=1 Tax=Mesorhizobium sp. M0174 TaxID=2956904 RepID=UPI00333D0207